ncbi:MAG: ThuA domain-containing protein [Thermoguttaceae bacterium]|nr:ThuA domain-containing protein [Thermoguttaceae bacterium]
MKRRDFLRNTGLSIALASTFPAGWGFAEEKKGKILYFDLSTEWEHPPTVDEEDGTSFSAKVVKKLGADLGYDVDCTKDGTVFDGDLSQYKAFVFFTCGDLDKAPEGKKGITATGQANFFKAIREGAGFVGIHSATDTWQCTGPLFENQPVEERTEYIKMVGGDFITHGEIQDATLTVTEPVELPCLKKFSKNGKIVFHDEWYTMKNFNKDMHVLLVQETEGMKKTDHNACYNRPAYPSSWIRMEGKGRVAYTAVGHGIEMWQEPFVQAIISDLISFVVGNFDMDMTPNMDKVCPDAETLPNL